MTASEKFKVNQRVRHTQQWLTLIHAPAQEGTVKGFSHDKRLVSVHIDGHPKAWPWHPDFWEVIE